MDSIKGDFEIRSGNGPIVVKGGITHYEDTGFVTTSITALMNGIPMAEISRGITYNREVPVQYDRLTLIGEDDQLDVWSNQNEEPQLYLSRRSLFGEKWVRGMGLYPTTKTQFDSALITMGLLPPGSVLNRK